MWLIIIGVIVLLGALAVLGMGLRMPGLMLLATGLAALVLGFLVLIGQNRPDDAENRDQGGQIYYLNSGVTAERDPHRSAVATRDDIMLAQWSDAHAANELSLQQARSIGLAIIDQSDVLSQERGADAPYGGDLLQKLIRDGIITTEDLAGASAMSGSLCILPQRSRVAGGVDISIKHETEWLSGQGNYPSYLMRGLMGRCRMRMVRTSNFDGRKSRWMESRSISPVRHRAMRTRWTISTNESCSCHHVFVRSARGR